MVLKPRPRILFCALSGAPTWAVSGLFHVVFCPDTIRFVYRCLRSSERYGRPQRDTRSGGRGEELGGHFSDFGSSQPSSSLSSQLRPPQLQRKENNRVSPSPDNRFEQKSIIDFRQFLRWVPLVNFYLSDLSCHSVLHKYFKMKY